jgi:hypothetical protein
MRCAVVCAKLKAMSNPILSYAPYVLKIKPNDGEILAFYGDEYEDYCRLGYCAVNAGR